ncbi:MAG: ATP-binding protein [Desulfobacterales bacterium]|jgi:PAS domain S-box-containing protein
MNTSTASENGRRRLSPSSAALYRHLLTQAPVGIAFVDASLRIGYANPKAAEILSHRSADELIGRDLTDCPALAQEAVVDQIRRCLETGRQQIEQHPLSKTRSPAGAVRLCAEPMSNGKNRIIGVQLLLENLSEPRDVESAPHPLQRFESIGIVAEGIARDFSTVLWEIIGNTELAASEIEIGHPARYNLEQAEAACRRAQELIMRIVRFSRQTEQKRRPVKLSTVVGESLQQLSDSVPQNVRVEHHISTTRDLVLADPSEILQMLSHLYRNGIQAMAESGGLLQVSVVDVELEDEELTEHPGLIPGRYLLLTVMDTGPGIQPDIFDHVFEPFFSTKSPEHHSGLGLSIVRSIVRTHGGAVSLDSRPGKGTMIHLILPALHDAGDSRGARRKALGSGIGTILLVDNEPSVLRMRGRMINRLGYEVKAAGSSTEALASFERRPEAFDLVLTDQSLPDLAATKMAAKMKQIRQEVPILLCTGLSGSEVEAEAKAAGIDRLLLKPLRMKDLALVLREFLPACPPP